MTIRHLKIFIAVADTGTMSAAAAKLYLSQPTVSQAIRELEEHYNTLLFERLSKRLYITEAGKILLSMARHLEAQYDQLEDTMFQESLRTTLRIGTSITVGTCLIPYVMEELEKQYPKMDIYSMVSNTQDIEKSLLRSELDVAVVEGVVSSPDLIVTPIMEDQLVLVCSRQHPFFEREELRVSDLNHERFAIRENGSGTRKLFEEYLQEHHLQIKTAWEANCPLTIINAVLHSKVLAVMSASLLKHEIRHGIVRVFQNASGDWNRSFKLVYHKNKILSPEIQALRRILENYKTVDVLEGQEYFLVE